MYRININNSNNLTTTAIHQSSASEAVLADVIKNQLDTINPRVGGIGAIQRPEDLLMTTVKVEPNQDCAGTSNNPSSNGHLLYSAATQAAAATAATNKRTRVDGLANLYIELFFFFFCTHTFTFFEY